MHDLNDLRIFERVATLGSYTLAARSLGIKQKPHVAAVIRRLEQALGVELIVKSPVRYAPIMLTGAGRDLLRRSGEPLRKLAQALASAAASPTTETSNPIPRNSGQ